MDAYLESLVKKADTEEPVVTEADTSDAVEETVEPVVEGPSDAVEEIVKEPSYAEPKDEAPDEVDYAEDKDEAPDEIYARDIDEAPDEVDAEDEADEADKVDENPEPAPVVKAAERTKKNSHKVGDSLTVQDLRVFNVPDIKSPFRWVTGTIKIIGNVQKNDGAANFAIIEFMKPGFGIVRGYAADL